MFKIDTQDIKRLEADLYLFSKTALPFATRKTLNDLAFQSQKIARADIIKDLITRNRYTVQSIRVKQAVGSAIPRQMSFIGSTAEYMRDQEFGKIKKARGRVGVVLPTSYSAGQSDTAQPRLRLPKKVNKLASISLSKRRKAGASRKQQNLIAVRMAAKTGKRFVFLETEKTKGIFKVINSGENAKVKMVYDMSRKSVSVPRKPWLKPAFDESIRMLPAFYADALRFQIARHRLFSKT